MWQIILIIVSILTAHYVVWRQLHTEYTDGEIFSLSLGLTLVSLTSLWWPYLGLILGLGALIVWCKKMKWDVWEWLDVVAPVSLLVAFILAWTPGLSGWPIATIAIAGWFLVHVLGLFYRQFGWYKSGRLGFVGFAALGWWGIVQLMVANMDLSAVYSLACIELATVVALYMRSGRKLEQDFKIIWPKAKR